jgi:hypothetical protein
MKLISSVIRWLWWLGLCYIPIALWKLERQFMDSIGCPPAGDCYVPGSEILIDFDVLIIGLAFYLWPVCAWFLGGRYVFVSIRSLLQNRLTLHSRGTR